MKNLTLIATALIISALFPASAHTEIEPVVVRKVVYEWHINWDQVDDIGVKRLTVEDVKEQIQ